MSQALLKTLAQPPSFKQKLLGSLKALAWARASSPPLTTEVEGVYAAALEKLSGEKRALVARALVWADLRLRLFRPDCAAAYREAARAYPDDERCTFYVAALLVHGLIPDDPELARQLHARLVRPAWRNSALWTRLELSREASLEALSDHQGTQEAISALESAFQAAPEVGRERVLVARRLAAAYRQSERSDESAEAIARYVLAKDAGDLDNIVHLARILDGRKDESGDAFSLYLRAWDVARLRSDAAQMGYWSKLLARLCLERGQVDRDLWPPLYHAHGLAPKDRLLEAAAAYAAALNDESVWAEPEALKILGSVVAYEPEIRPLFVQRRWRWETLTRALALAWGKAGRTDRAAVFVYGRAVELCPEDRDLWGHYAAALASMRDASPDAVAAYERARAGGRAGDLVLAMLGHAYLRMRAHQGPDRAKAVAVWQELYTRGLAGPEVADVLGEALSQSGETSDIAVHLWESIAEREPENGAIRCHLARAHRTRGNASEAIRWFREAARLLPEDFTVLLECAQLLAENTPEAAEVVQLMEKATALPEGKHNLEAHVLLGEAQAGCDRREEAKATFQKILTQMDANHTRSLLMLARLSLRYEQEGVARAETFYARALEQDPNNPETYRRLADLYHEEGEGRLEQAALERYLQLSSSDASQYRQLADMYIQRGDWEKAESALRQVIAQGQADKKTYSLLGEVLHARSRTA